ncbi:hypothetical protein [Alkalihalobacillus deserti]|uniref:hypothetical protein n=1 Tax=Alkalihalobacillus deserti TaxID=2879466 RepID=UPI001D159D29|nr:hypothetical protein [Alkalihalobacillus deserti]
MIKKLDNKRMLIILSLILVFVIVFILNNYLNPNIEASIKDEYTWMENVQILHTDWYGNKGLTFFVAEGFSDDEEHFCKGYVSKKLFNTKTSWEGCVPLSNSKNDGANEGVYGTSEFFGKPIISGFNLANTPVKVQGQEVKTYTYNDLKAWYIFSPPAEPNFMY